MRAAVVTSIYGAYDTLKPVLPQNGGDVDWVLVTDSPPSGVPDLGWRTVYHPRPGVHPNRAAKNPKLFPWDYTPAPASVWVDAAFRIISPDFVREAVALADPIAQFVHPWRDCVYTEAAESARLAKYAGESARLAKYAGEDFDTQAREYREVHGHPEHWGLWAAGVIARQHTTAVREFSDDWAELIDRGTLQDQVSEPVALRFNGLRPTAFPGDHLANDWLRHEGHLGG